MTDTQLGTPIERLKFLTATFQGANISASVSDYLKDLMDTKWTGVNGASVGGKWNTV